MLNDSTNGRSRHITVGADSLSSVLISYYGDDRIAILATSEVNPNIAAC